MKNKECKKSPTKKCERPNNKCCCSISALEPHDECPIHGFVSKAFLKCIYCGRFMSEDDLKVDV